MKLLLIVAFTLLCTTIDASFVTKFIVAPGKGELYDAVRTNATAVYNKCEQEITTPDGLIEQFYDRGTVKNDERCTWTIKAPKDKVVDINYLSFNLESDKQSVYDNSAESSVVSFFDRSRPEGEQLLKQFFISTAEKISRFLEPIRGKEMFIEIKYHDHKDFLKQKIFVSYQVLDVDQ